MHDRSSIQHGNPTCATGSAVPVVEYATSVVLFFLCILFGTFHAVSVLTVVVVVVVFFWVKSSYSLLPLSSLSIMERHENPYEILGVPFDADEETVKKAFRKAAKKYHPDRQQSEEDREKAHDVFAKYSAAYEILTDPVKRYDWKQAYAAKTSNSSSNPVPSTPSTGKKPTYCPQSAPARTSTAYTYKPPSSDKPSSSAPPPPPPFTQEKRSTPSESPKKKSSSSSAKSTSQTSWQPPPPKKQAPPPPPFHGDEQDTGSKKRGTRKSTSASTSSVSSSSYRYTNRGKETLERRAKEEPSGSYSLVPQLLVSGSHLKEDLRPRLRSSCIFSEPQQSNAAGKEDMRPRPRSSSIFSDLQDSNSNIQNPSFRRTSSYRPADSTKRTSTARADDNRSQRGRSLSPRRSSAVPKKNQEPLKSSRSIRSQSPRQRRESTANHVEPASPREVPMTPPTKARTFFGLVSKSPKTNNFLKELMRDTRVDAEPYRRKKSVTNNDDRNGKDGEDSSKEGGRRSSQAGGGSEKSLKRSQSLSGSPSDTTPASSSSFPSTFRFSMSRRASEKQMDTSYSFSTEQEMEAINSPKPLRRGRRPKE